MASIKVLRLHFIFSSPYLFMLLSLYWLLPSRSFYFPSFIPLAAFFSLHSSSSLSSFHRHHVRYFFFPFKSWARKQALQVVRHLRHIGSAIQLTRRRVKYKVSFLDSLIYTYMFYSPFLQRKKEMAINKNSFALPISVFCVLVYMDYSFPFWVSLYVHTYSILDKKLYYVRVPQRSWDERVKHGRIFELTVPLYRCGTLK